MFMGFNSHFTKFMLHLKPLMNLLLYTIFIVLTNLLMMSPMFLKEHKEYNMLFYLHSTMATYNFLLYIMTMLLVLMHLISKQTILLELLKINAMFGMMMSIFSLLTGMSWGIFSWGNFVFFDNKVYLILIMLFVYMFVYFVYTQNKTKYNHFILSVMLMSLPFWKLLSFWWNTYHQSFTITTIGAALPNALLIYFLLLFYLLMLIYFYWMLMEISFFMMKNKLNT